MKRRSASMNGTARNTTPGTSVATVTGIQTCWPRRSIGLDQLALHVAADAARLLGDEPAEVAGLAVEGEHGHEPVERRRRRRARPLAQRVDLA